LVCVKLTGDPAPNDLPETEIELLFINMAGTIAFKISAGVLDEQQLKSMNWIAGAIGPTMPTQN
jgi:hypothetical protein